MGMLISIVMGISTFLAAFSLLFAVVKLSWKAMLISLIASLPISTYLLALNSPFSYLGLTPILLLVFMIILRRQSKKVITQ
ncbi:hypothetical protein [Sporosarcina koreensis]|uniref:hypothetical protein n=1 Tax=Sporosarcina koreensis TaxID=334735 RepID=UPI000590F05F|nr:hypothetical protein [Sporosarcina koreensis]